MSISITPPAFLAEICDRLGPHVTAADSEAICAQTARGQTDEEKQYWADRLAASLTRGLVETSWTVAFVTADELVHTLHSHVELSTLRQTLREQFKLSAQYLRDAGGLAAAVYAEQIPAFNEQLDRFLIAYAPPAAWELPAWADQLPPTVRAN